MGKNLDKLINNKVFKFIKECFSSIDEAHRSRVTELTGFELRELENLFMLLLLGSFSGVPSPPTFFAVELLPFLEDELKVFVSRAKNANDSLAEVVGLLDID